MHEETFLRIHPWFAKTRANEAIFQPIPTDMAGEILLSGTRQQVASHFLTVIRPSGPSRGVFRQFLPEFSIVEGDKQAAPVLTGSDQPFEHGNGAQRHVDVVILLGGLRQAISLRGEFRGELGQLDLAQMSPVQHHPELPPLASAPNHPVKRLRVEELVGK